MNIHRTDCLGGFTPVRLNGVETANFVNLRGANPVTSTATADYEFTLIVTEGPMAPLIYLQQVVQEI